MTSEFSWLLVGAGQIARKRVAAALQQPGLSRLDGVYSRSSENAVLLSSQFAGCRSFGDLQVALHESCSDAVYIATPVDAHVSLALTALRAGKHVLVEKPLGLRAEDSRRVATEAQQLGLMAACAYYRRCSARYSHLKDMLAHRELGSILSVRLHYASWYGPGNDGWRVTPGMSGGGPVADMGSHMFDLVIGCFGDPRLIHAEFQHRVHSYSAEDSAFLSARLPDGGFLFADLHWCSRSWGHQFEVVGSEGRVLWDPFDGGPVMLTLGREQSQIELPQADNVHAGLVENFVLATRGEAALACSAAEAVRTDEFLDAIRCSALVVGKDLNGLRT